MAQFQDPGFVVIAGAAGGIGQEVGFTFAEAGAKGVLFADIKLDGASRAADHSKSLATAPEYEALSMELDMTDTKSVQATVDYAIRKFGRVDCCVNASGKVDTEAYNSIDQVTEDDYDRVLRVNAKGTFLLTKAIVAAMKLQDIRHVSLGRHGSRDVGRGSIVNVSSGQSIAAAPHRTPYVTSKHAILGLTRASAMDCKPFGIRVNQVSPAWVRTPMYDENCRREPLTPEVVRKFTTGQGPMEAHEVASACLYLCSTSAVSVNGANLVMDHGITVGPVI
ncbi:hypothetical protein PG985_004529 [Apiospora marii]|uniref:Uncharacterized protein n=1 Tax=Apiospora marii TaxID=335849 RepID=A0ABR1S9L3_9PEZI